MPVLPIVPLPVSDVYAPPLLLRVDLRPHHATIYVRRETDQQNWVCVVRSLQEVLSPSQTARPLDVEAVVMCLYNRFAIDSSDPEAPLELTRREVAFFQPESWTNNSYRLTMRIAVHPLALTATLATPASPPIANSLLVEQGDPHDASPTAHAIPVPIVDITDETIVFGFNLEPTDDDIERHTPKIYGSALRRSATLRLFGAAFPHSSLNWVPPTPSSDLVLPEKDRLALLLKSATPLELTLTAVHPKGPVLVVLSLAERVIHPTHVATFQPLPGGDLYHTVMQYTINAAPKTHVQVVVLPGSSCLVEGTTVAIREINAY